MEEFCCHFEQWSQYSTCELYSGSKVVKKDQPSNLSDADGQPSYAYAFALPYPDMAKILKTISLMIVVTLTTVNL